MKTIAQHEPHPEIFGPVLVVVFVLTLYCVRVHRVCARNGYPHTHHDGVAFHQHRCQKRGCHVDKNVLEWVRVQSCHAHTPLPFVMCFVDVSVEPFGVHDAVRVVEQHIGKQNTRGQLPPEVARAQIVRVLPYKRRREHERQRVDGLVRQNTSHAPPIPLRRVDEEKGSNAGAPVEQYMYTVYDPYERMHNDFGVFFFLVVSTHVFYFEWHHRMVTRARNHELRDVFITHAHERDALKLEAAEASSQMARRDAGSRLMCSRMML